MAAAPGFLQLKGLPYQVTKEQVIAFLAPVNVLPDDVILLKDYRGRMTGVALLKVATPADAEACLAKNRTHIGERYVEVLSISLAEYERLLRETQNPPAGSSLLRLRGLPYRASAVEIAEFFTSFAIKQNGIYIVCGADGRPTGEGFVDFVDEQTASWALAAKQRGQMGNRYIELFVATPAELQSALRSYPSPYGVPGDVSALAAAGMVPPGMGAPAPIATLGLEFAVRMRGMPYGATEMDVQTFLGDIHIAPGAIHMLDSVNGRSSGEAVVELLGQADVDRALTHNRQFMGTRYVELFPLSRGEVVNILSRQFGPAAAPVMTFDPQFGWQMPAPRPMYAPAPMPPMVAGGADHCVMRMRGLPYSATAGDVMQFFAGYSILAESIRFGQDARGRPSGDAWITATSQAEAQRAIHDLNRRRMGTRYIELFQM